MTPEAPNVLHPKLSSKFDVWDPSEMILFHKNRKIGANKVTWVVNGFCQIFGMDYCTNHCVRASVIKALLRLGYSQEMICKLTGHKNPKSLANYDPGIADLMED